MITRTRLAAKTSHLANSFPGFHCCCSKGLPAEAPNVAASPNTTVCARVVIFRQSVQNQKELRVEATSVIAYVTTVPKTTVLMPRFFSETAVPSKVTIKEYQCNPKTGIGAPKPSSFSEGRSNHTIFRRLHRAKRTAPHSDHYSSSKSPRPSINNGTGLESDLSVSPPCLYHLLLTLTHLTGSTDGDANRNSHRFNGFAED